MDNLVRNNIAEIKPYIPGKPIDEIKRRFNLKRVIKLASNENPLSPPLKVIRAIRKAIPEINRYPDGACYYLREALSKRLGVDGANLIFGNGSDEIIDITIKTFVNDDEEIITADVTFLEYEIVSRINSRRLRLVGLKDYRYDLEGIRNAVSPKTKLIFIANPNNPTGTYVNRREVENFLEGLPGHIIVVFDEAYNEFIDVPDFPHSLSYLDKNVILLRTFSKAYALAGLRLGFAIAKREFIRYMQQARQPFNVNSLAQEAALAAISDEDFINKTKRLITSGKKYLYEALDRLGVEYVKSAANFILIDVKRDCVEVFEEMLKCGVIVRDMKQYGLDSHIRVTIGTERENREFIRVLQKVLRDL